jgi:hypothetical protein
MPPPTNKTNTMNAATTTPSRIIMTRREMKKNKKIRTRRRSAISPFYGRDDQFYS